MKLIMMPIKAVGYVTFLLLGFCFQLSAQTNIAGLQSGVWTVMGSPYIITGMTTVPLGSTLTINPGVEVRFPPAQTSKSMLIVQGTLKAEGNAGFNIKFVGGASYNLFDQRGPVLIDSMSINNVLQYVNIDSLGYYYNSDLTAAVIIRSSSCTISNCNFHVIRGSGIQIGNANPDINHNNFILNAGMDVIMDMDKLPSLTANNALKIGFTANIPLSSDVILTSDNAFYRLLATQTIPVSKTLTIAPGVEMQFPAAQNSNSRLIVQGTLNASGNVNNNIKLTGGSGYVMFDQRGPVIIDSMSQNSVLQYVTIDSLGYYYYSDLTAGVIVLSNSCTISNCNFRNTRGSGLKIGNFNPVVSNNVFTANLSMDVILDLNKLQVLSGNNPLKIGLTAEVPVTTNNTLSNYNVFYRILATQIIPTSRSLTIDPGVELQFPAAQNANSRLIIQGTLAAQGTSLNRIKFSGGTYNMFDQRGPIVIDTMSQNTILQYVTFDSLGYYYSSDVTAAVIVLSNSCTISNCRIQNSRGSGLQVGNVNPVISNNNFFANLSMDVILNLDKLVVLSGNNALKIGLTATTPVLLNNILTNDNVFYRILATQTIPAGKSLTVQAGVEVQFPAAQSANNRLIIQGTLNASGSSGNNIKFTGGGFGMFDQRGPVIVESTSQNSVFNYVTFDRLGYYYSSDATPAIIISSSSCTVMNCAIQNIRGTGIQVGNATPTISNNIFTATDALDVILDLDKLTVLSGNNPLKIGLTSLAPVGNNNTLTNNNVFYRLLGAQVIPVAKTLNIQPGVEVQFPNTQSGSSQLIINGTLKALGEVANRIKFTGGGLGMFDQRGPVVFETTSQNSILQFVTVDALGYYYNDVSTSAIVIRTSSCMVTNCIIQNSRGSGLSITNLSAPLITKSCFINNNGAVYATGGRSQFIYCNFISNNSTGIINTGSSDSILARNCWWGSSSGPRQTITNPSGLGDQVSARVVYNPFSLSALDCNSNEIVLPVAIINFKVVLFADYADCIWETASEINAKQFIIQRSTNGNTYIDLAEIASSQVNTNMVSSYKFSDRSISNGVLLYRLKLVDKDGSFTYSQIISVNVKNLSFIRIYPNPAKYKLFVQVESNKSENGVFDVVDLQGKIIQKQTYQLQAGSNRITINISALPKGLYALIKEGEKVQKAMFLNE